MNYSKAFMSLPMVLMASAAVGFGQYQTSAAQNHEMAKPGTINYVEGQVSRNNQELGPRASVLLQPGDELATGNGFAEVLLTPGSFLRLGPNTQMRLTSAGLAATQIQLDRGVASMEVDELIAGMHLGLTMNGGASARVEKKGLYNFNADQQSVRVLDGKVDVTAADHSKSIGKGDELLLASDQPLKSHSFDVKAEKAQPLYVWSEARSRDEAQANVAIARNVAAYGGWYGAGWYYDPYLSSYAFLPGAGYFYSPFGLGFYSPSFIGYYGRPFGYGYYGAFRGRAIGGMNARVSVGHLAAADAVKD